MPPLEDVYVAYGMLSLAVSLLIAAIATMGQSRRFGALMAGSSLLPLAVLYEFTLTDGFRFWQPVSATGVLVWTMVCAPLLVMGLVVALVGLVRPRVWVGPGRYVGMGVSVLVGAYNMEHLSAFIAAAN